jgi:hypothetical protein
MDQYNFSTDQYFATLPNDEIGGALQAKIDNFYTYIKDSGVYQIWANSYLNYYASFRTAGSLGQSGEQGEYSILKVNHYKTNIKRLITMTAKERIAYDAIATNSDYKSLAQAKVANQVLDYFTKQNQLNGLFRKALEIALWAGESFFSTEWNTTGGNQRGVTEEGIAEYDGDFEFDVLSPLDVIREIGLTKGNADRWFITRKFKNKWDLAAKYPNKAGDIIDVSMDSDGLLRYTSLGVRGLFDDNEQIPYYEFYHKKTEALPEGRYTIFLNDETVLYDGPLPYKEMPLYRLAADDLEGSMFGYTVAYDMLPIQEVLNSLHSTVTTNNLTFGVQNILLPKNSNIIPNALSKGLNAIEYDKDMGEPKALQLTASSTETYNYIRALVEDMRTVCGMNDVSMGEVPYSNMSGSALALLQAQAIEFNSNLQAAYVSLIERVGTAMIHILQEYAKTPRVAAIAGKTSAPELLQFKGSDIENVNRVTVDVGNALANTIAGRTDMAEKLLDKKLIKNAEEFISVITTGNIEVMLDPESDEALLIKDENEILARGQSTPVMATDQHIQHIKGHRTVTNSVEARKNAALVQATTDHIQAHIDALKNIDPNLLTIIGEQPLGGAPAPGNGPEAPAMGPPGGQPAAPAMPQQPALPKNPLSGQAWNPTDGGLPQ